MKTTTVSYIAEKTTPSIPLRKPVGNKKISKGKLPRPVQDCSDFSHENQVTFYLILKRETHGCLASFMEKQVLIAAIFKARHIHFKIQLKHELKTLVFAGRDHQRHMKVIVFHLPADKHLKNENDKLDTDYYIHHLQSISIDITSLKFRNGLVSGTLNPISIAINFPDWIQIFDSCYLDPGWTLVTTNAGDKNYGSVFDIKDVFGAFTRTNTNFHFLPITIT